MNEDDRFFVDTNVLLYSADSADPAKQGAAARWLRLLWENGAGRVSWQVLHEFYVNAIRIVRTPTAKARELVEIFVLWQPADTTLGLIQRAWHWADEGRLSYWDSLIVAAAERSACTWLLSEDFQTGRKFGQITVVNPFRSRPEDFGLSSPSLI